MSTAAVFHVSLLRMLFRNAYNDEEEKALRNLTQTTYDGRTIVKANVLFASKEFKEAVEIVGQLRQVTI